MVLNQILQEYAEYYGKNHVNTSLAANPVSDTAYLLDLKRSGIVGDFQIVVAVPVFVQKHVTVFGDPPFQNLGKQFLHLHIPDEFELIQ